MTAKELYDKLNKFYKEYKEANVFFRCYDEKGQPQDIPVFDIDTYYIEDKSVLGVKTFILDKYKIEKKEK